MTPHQIRDALAALKKHIGGPNTYLSLDFRKDPNPLHLTIYPNDILTKTRDEVFHSEAASWEALFTNANAAWETHKDRIHAAVIRRMALEIIRITADTGQCTDRDLRLTDFTEAQVTTYAQRAADEADTIAATGPFAVIQTQTPTNRPK